MKKKILLGLAATALIALMAGNVYATCVPAPPFCPYTCYPPGFTPGFWKHNIQVRLDLTNGAYSAFEGGPLDGVKLTDALMDSYLAIINNATKSSFTFEQLLGFLQGPGWSADRTNTANWFNFVAGYGPY